MNGLQRLKGLRILLVEPDPILRGILQTAFDTEGGFLMATDSGENGLILLEHDGFDIIVGEFDLPGMNGLEFFKRTVPLCPKGVKLLIADYGDVDPISKARQFGIDEIIEKPFPFSKLMEAFSRHFDRRAGKKTS
jgi:two-component system C4-dicarboxylate transport response regulator DctD